MSGKRERTFIITVIIIAIMKKELEILWPADVSALFLALSLPSQSRQAFQLLAARCRQQQQQQPVVGERKRRVATSENGRMGEKSNKFHYSFPLSRPLSPVSSNSVSARTIKSSQVCKLGKTFRPQRTKLHHRVSLT